MNPIADGDGADLCAACRKDADLPADSEEDMAENDPRLGVPAVQENSDDTDDEDDEDDDSSSVGSDSSVHTTCCVDCGKSFTLDAPVSRVDYNQNKHEQTCPPCRKDALPQPEDAECYVEATYHVYSHFRLPQGVTLYDHETNIAMVKKHGEGHPFTWWVKWDTLHYYDKDGVEQEVENDLAGQGEFMKHPIKVALVKTD